LCRNFALLLNQTLLSCDQLSACCTLSGGTTLNKRVLIGIAAASISAVALAQTALPKFNAAAIEKSNWTNARMTDLYQRLLSTTHPETFIAPDGLFGCSDEADCEAKGVVYYQRIGALNAAGLPTSSRGTMEAWLATHGFSANPLAPKPDEIRAVYFNRADLGFGRDLHCRTYRQGLAVAINRDATTRTAGVLGGDVPSTNATLRARASLQVGGTWSACYVTNFGDNANPLKPNGNEQQAIAKAKANTIPIATVAMDVYRPDTVGAVPEVRFYVFDTGNNFSTGPSPIPTALKGRLLPFAVLDNDHTWDTDGKKASPGTCLNCHGGTASFSTASPTHAVNSTVVAGANFLPFDAQLFGYDTTPGSPFTEVAQRQIMRQLNNFVKATQPVAPTITSTIDGWYGWCGGVTTVGCAIDDAGHPYTPAGWSTPTSAQLASLVATQTPNGTKLVNLYQQTSRKYCRTCHLANAGYFDVQDVNQAYRMKNKLNPAALTSSMPNAERTFLDYWADTSAQGSYAALWGPGGGVDAVSTHSTK
jgi:hypothetical protein